jgi:hypothetical protein
VPIVLAVWPNNTVSMIKMLPGFTMLDLYVEIDQEADPLDCQCYVTRHDDDGLYITFDWKFDDKDRIVTPKSSNLTLGTLAGKLKRLCWPSDIQRQYLRELSKNVRRQTVLDSAPASAFGQIPDMPAVPEPSFTVEQIRAMEQFCGVYLSYDSDGMCHYVGESINVPARVSKSREEIRERMIGIVKCLPYERKRIEAYFAALLNPPGNAISTHRMMSRHE